jgi:predicted nucleic acid-binding protein
MKRVYVDTSVFGGVFDDEFQRASQDFFDQVKNGQFDLVTSAVVQEEIAPAPQEVKDFFGNMLLYAEIVDIVEEALKLRYITPSIFCMVSTKLQFIRHWR